MNTWQGIVIGLGKCEPWVIILMDCIGKILVLTVTTNGVQETPLTNLNLNKRWFTKSLKIFIFTRNGTSYIEWRHNKNKEFKF